MRAINYMLLSVEIGCLAAVCALVFSESAQEFMGGFYPWYVCAFSVLSVVLERERKDMQYDEFDE